MTAMKLLGDLTVTGVLQSIDENIFIIDMESNVAWMNNKAKKLINSLKEHLHLTSAEELIGKNIHNFHKNPSYQQNILLNGPFPYSTTVALFNRYTAKLIVNPLTMEDETKGYILLWKDVTDRNKKAQETRQLINELSTPILPAVTDETLLVPLIGTITHERLNNLTEKLLNECTKYQAQYVLIDFSGVTAISDKSLAAKIDDVTKMVELLGAEVIYVGFTPEVVKNFMNLGIQPANRTFKSFREGIRFVVDKMGYVLQKKQ